MANESDCRVQEPASGERGPDVPLRAYLQAKQSVAQLLRELQEFADRCAPWVTDRVHHLMTRLGEDRFQLVVVGQFKRGKSSLMNAIVGRALLPTGTIPVTSAITSLRYGSRLRVTIKRSDHAVDQEIPIGALSDFVTERGNPDNQKHVLSAEIEMPAPFLRRGLHFIDTPGIGSAHEHNTTTTLAFLPEADAAIFVTGADGPLSENELQFLDAVRQHVRKLFFVLNKIDQLDPAEREETIRYTTNLLAKRLGITSIRVFPFSAARALTADRSDADALAASGLPGLESALATFLNDERRVVFLVAVLDRAVAALEDTRFMLDLRQRAVAQRSMSGDSTVADLERRLGELESERQAVISRLARRIAEWQASTLDPSLERLAADTQEAALRDLPAVVEDAFSTARDYYTRADDTVRARVQARAVQWMRDSVGPIDDCARGLAADARNDIVALIEKPRSVAALMLGLNAEHRDALNGGTRWEWVPPPLEKSSDGPHPVNLGNPGGEPSHAPLPHSLATRVAVRWLSRRLTKYIEHAIASLRDTVLGHLQGCVTEMDRSSERRLTDECRRVILVVKPDGAAEQSADAVNGAATTDPVGELQMLFARIISVRDALLRHEPLPEAAPAPASLATTSPGEPREANLKSPSLPNGQRTVTGTCAICAVASDAVFDFLCQYQNAIGHDPAVQRQFLASRGLCSTHTWHLEHISSPRGLSLGYPPLLDEVEKRVRSMANLPLAAAIQRLEELASHRDTCAACLARQKAEQRTAERLAKAFMTPEGRATFERSRWLCMRHLRLTLTGVDGDIAAMLFRVHAHRLADLSESMREFVIKHDARRRGLMTEEEVRAYRQALVLLVGERYLFRTESEE